MNETGRGRRVPAAEADLFEVASAPCDFQFGDIGYEPTDDPMAAMAADRAAGGRGIARLAYCCPKTGRPCGSIAIGHPDKPAEAPSWQWDGNLDAPTLQPSINCVGGCGWHGFLIAGVFTGC